MRKYILIIALLCFSAHVSNAQLWKNEIYVDYSQITIPQSAYVLGGVFGAVFSLGHFSFENTCMTGALSVGYNRNATEWFGYGGQILAEYITSDTFTTDSDGNKTYNGKYNMCLVSFMPTLKFIWFEYTKLRMYSKVGIGPGISFGNDLQVIPSFQVSPVCADFGAGKYKGIVELGGGMQGCVTVGIKRIF